MAGDVLFYGLMFCATGALGWGWHYSRRRHAARQDRAGRVAALVTGNLCGVLAVVAVMFLGAEAYYRFVFDTTDSFALMHTTTRWFQRHVRTNNWNFRDDFDYTLDRPAGRRRVSVLGDSFTFGHGVAEISDRFADRLHDRYASQYEWHALAQPGLDTGGELTLLADLFDRGYETDLVVLVYGLNDLSDLMHDWQVRLRGILDEHDRRGFLLRHSAALDTWSCRWQIAADPSLGDYYRFVGRAYRGPTWEQQCERLTGLHDLCRRRGVTLVVVLFPFVHALADDELRKIHVQLVEFWKSRDVPCLDLWDELARHAGESLVVNRHDAHPNDRAHAVAAEAIGAFLDAGVLTGLPASN